jgi:hypothetical protein
MQFLIPNTHWNVLDWKIHQHHEHPDIGSVFIILIIQNLHALLHIIYNKQLIILRLSEIFENKLMHLLSLRIPEQK